MSNIHKFRTSNQFTHQGTLPLFPLLSDTELRFILLDVAAAGFVSLLQPARSRALVRFGIVSSKASITCTSCATLLVDTSPVIQQKADPQRGAMAGLGRGEE